MSTPTRHILFIVASAREPGHVGNTEWLAQQAAAALPADVTQRWLHLAPLNLPPFVDVRHTTGVYDPPTGDLATVLDATLAATDIVLVAPVYWFSLPSSLKTMLDHWSGWLRVPGLDFKARMAHKTLHLVATNNDRAKAQPMIDSVALCAAFMGMRWGGPQGPVLWGKGGAPGAVQADAEAVALAARFLS